MQDSYVNEVMFSSHGTMRPISLWCSLMGKNEIPLDMKVKIMNENKQIDW